MLKDVLAKLFDSRDFTVGGGVASALAGGMAASMVGMVARLSMGKEYGLDDSAYERYADELDKLSEELRKGACGDEAAFLGIKAAFALPKGTDEEKAVRRRAVEDAAVVAASVPRDNGFRSWRVLEIAAELEGKYNTAAGSDMECALMLARAAVKGCALNIEANLSLIKTPERHDELAEAAKKLVGRV